MYVEQSYALCTIFHVHKFQLFFNNLLGFALCVCGWQATADDTSKVSDVYYDIKNHTHEMPDA